MVFFYKDMNFVWSAWDRRMISFGNLIGGSYLVKLVTLVICGKAAD